MTTMTRDETKTHVENVLTRWMRQLPDATESMRDSVCSIELWRVDDVIPNHCLVSEVNWHDARGGSTYMQSDLPYGLAVCAQVERWMVALMYGDAHLIAEERATLNALLRGI